MVNNSAIEFIVRPGPLFFIACARDSQARQPARVYNLGLFLMSNSDEVTAVIPAPDGRNVNFDHPTRSWTTIHQIYWIYGSATALALFFLVQNLYVKLYINRKIDIETGRLGRQIAS
jgi:hypothetical protein